MRKYWNSPNYCDDGYRACSRKGEPPLNRRDLLQSTEAFDTYSWDVRRLATSANASDYAVDFRIFLDQGSAEMKSSL
jgi:hypothetical protein